LPARPVRKRSESSARHARQKPVGQCGNRKLLPNEVGDGAPAHGSAYGHHEERVLPTDTMRADVERDEHAMTPDDRALALLLITVWAARTGRVPRPVPVSELTPEELVNFWADDQLEEPLDTPVHEWPR
jgi:hypothetical protein